jgi:Flp pilus assembly protein TadG
MMKNRRHGKLRRLVRDRRGVTAVEFALILPALLLVSMGVAEFGNAFLVNRKLTVAADTVADLVAQETTVSSAYLTDVFRAADGVIFPYSALSASYRVTSIKLNGAGAAVVDWSVNRDGTAVAAGTPFDVPANLMAAGESVIVSDVTYNYTPVFGTLITGSIVMSDRVILRPRKVLIIPKT